jgi:hypothetical protein
LDASEGPGGPIIRRSRCAKKAQLATVIGLDLIRDEPEQGQSRGNGSRVQPAVELPTDPFGNRPGSQCPVMTPKPHEMFAVLGFRLDGQSSARQAERRQPPMEFVGQRLGGEGGHIDPFGWGIKLSCHGEVERRGADRKRAFIEPTSQPMGELAFGAEPSQHDVGREGG